MRSRTWMLRGLVVVALLAPPLAVWLFGHSGPPRQPDDREADIARVYTALPARWRYAELGQWCRLRTLAATADEADMLRRAVDSAPDPANVWCSPFTEFPLSEGRVPRLPADLRWVRLGDPADSSRWIGLGVWEQYNTGWTQDVILCRVPVGFQPAAGPGAEVNK